MATLLEVRNNHGFHAACDARCYNATTNHCTCICAGQNHGVGYQAALKNSRQNGLQLIQNFDKSHPHLNLTWFNLPKPETKAKPDPTLF